MNILHAIQNRCSTRSYDTKQISEKELGLVLEAARMAPSGKNIRGMKLYVMQNQETIQRLNQILVEAVKRGNADEIPADSKMVAQPNYSFCFDAPTFVITTHKKAAYNAFVDTGCLLENAMLQATELGIGTCWINLIRRAQKDPEVQVFLKEAGVNEDEFVTGGLAIGYPAVPFRQNPKKDGNDIIFLP